MSVIALFVGVAFGAVFGAAFAWIHWRENVEAMRRSVIVLTDECTRMCGLTPYPGWPSRDPGFCSEYEKEEAKRLWRERLYREVLSV